MKGNGPRPLGFAKCFSAARDCENAFTRGYAMPTPQDKGTNPAYPQLDLT